MKNTTKYIALSGVSLLLAACGGSGSSFEPERPSYDEMETAAMALVTEYETAELRETDLPASGTATYAGYVGGDLTDSDTLDDLGSVVGELSVTASFAPSDEGTLTGGATNFMHSETGAIDGTLALTGTFDSVLGIQAELTGTITDVSTGDEFDADILADGAFFGGAAGTAPSAMKGEAYGDITPTDPAVPVIWFDGGFIAEVQ